MSNHNTNRNLKSSIPQKNPYDATGYHDRKITSPIEVAISRIAVNFGNFCQNTLNFAARVGLATSQKSDTHQKTTAGLNRRGFVLS